jgi:hypothetical protein
MKFALLVLFFATLISPTALLAALGEKTSSIERDKKSFAAKEYSVERHQQYSVHEISREGLSVHEYVSNDGTVFAVSWHGVSHPDLNKLLGSHLKDYRKAMKPKQHKGHQQFSAVKTQDIVVEKGGHMRSARGRAYVPSLIPQGMSADEIQ